uniref:Probable glutamyl endopeptidase, chloroplastic n=2 Tax=Pyramimonas obovata TaxID=1411642 RepID=A0A7S0MZS3_9CHLO|mmetsp:Transcript_17321/g.37687  ORF Transcript_17321/g.37687 Transcript_17321/m.37687 type:complete len:710 (+) Transcript_17321:31-2160(+)
MAVCYLQATLECRRILPDYHLNTVYEEYSWVDSETIVATVIPTNRGPPPERPETPSGPRIQSNMGGGKAQNRTYTDLLKDKHDEHLFDYYAKSRLVMVSVPTGEEALIDSEPRIYTRATPSPNGKHLLVEYLERPYSYLVPCGRFPKRVELWTAAGDKLRELEVLPLAEDIPIVHNSCRAGRRSIGWRSDKECEIAWVEAQDGGDPRIEVSPRDIVYTLCADDAQGEPEQLISTDFRFGGIQWGDDKLALVYESWYKTRRSIMSRFSPGDRAAAPTVVFDRYYEDVYTDPGSPTTRRLTSGDYVLATFEGGKKLLLMGSGHRPEGKQPFVDLFDIETGEKQRIWESSPPHLEYPVSIMEPPSDEELTMDGISLLISRETPKDPPQYYVLKYPDPFNTTEPPTENLITDFPHPYAKLRDLQKEIIQYEREDGTPLTATLYTPPGYDSERDGPLPTLLWAYPREFKTKEAAGQLRDSPYRFSGIGPSSPLLHLARGYAVLDGPTMPIIGEGDAEPNDTYVEQLTSSARAAVEEVVRRGVADPARIAVGGHSYGAFMAANLLAYAPELFCCAIARSGAYNRTLTPFGFQAEERTVWEAPETYMKMSPFMVANKIKKPILLIHGEEDNNTGTFPMQSERFYSALQGHGATCKLVLLPHESHSYRGKESILHGLYEMCEWLDMFCAQRKELPDNEDGVAREPEDKAASKVGSSS